MGSRPSTATAGPANPSRRNTGTALTAGEITSHPANSDAISSPYWMAANSTPTRDPIAAPSSAYATRDVATISTSSSAAPSSPTSTAANMTAPPLTSTA